MPLKIPVAADLEPMLDTVIAGVIHRIPVVTDRGRGILLVIRA